MFGGRWEDRFSLKGMPLFAAACILMVACIGGPLLGAAQASAISQGFLTTEDNIAAGAMMSFKVGSPNEVELAHNGNANQLVGVIGEDSLLALSSDDREVQVVTSGVAPVLVSDMNGVVKAGDKITTSPIDGVGMKATDSTQIIGTAQTDFDPTKAKEWSIADRKGDLKDVHLGLVDAQINVMFYQIEEEPVLLPSFMRTIANSVAGREVSAVRVLVSTVALVLGFVSIAVLLYSSVRSSIISIGRNPLSEGAVHKSLLEVGLITVGILLLTLLAIYLILTT